MILTSLSKSSDQCAFDFLDKDSKSVNMLSWSPNDKYLAIACETIQIYQVVGDKLSKLHEFCDHSLEIISLAWSPDSTRIVSTALDSKIFVRNLNENTTHNI